MSTPTPSPFARTVSALWRDANEAEALASFRHAMMQKLNDLVGFDSAVVAPYPSPLGSGGPDDVVAIDYPAAYYKYFTENIRRYDADLKPFLVAMRANGGMAISTDVYSRRELETMTICREIHIPVGVTSALTLTLSFRGRATTTATLSRHGRSRAFRSADMESLRALVPLCGLADAAVVARCGGEAEAGDGVLALTARERQAALLLRSGLQDKEIAAARGTSSETVKKQTRAIYEKLGVSGRVQLIARFGPSRS